MSIIKTDILQSSVGYGNTCKVHKLHNGRVWAWVAFNGENTVSIMNDYNVNTITDRGTGLYTVDFATSHVGTATSLSLFGNAGNVSSTGNDHTNCTCIFPDGAPVGTGVTSFPIRTHNGGASDRAQIGAIFCGGEHITKESFSAPTPWLAGTEAADNQWRGIAYGNGTWVTVAGNDGNTSDRFQYSKDNGKTWTAVTAPNSNTWYDVEYGGGVFVAMGGGNSDSNRAAWSTDGINWTLTDLTNEDSFTASDSPFICYGGTNNTDKRFVAVGRLGTNRVRYSTNGKTWSSAVGSTNSSWYGVCFGLNRWVAVASSGTNRVMYTTDATDFSSWTEVAAAEDNSWRSIAYGNGKFVAVANDGTNRLMYSTDATSWSNSGVSGFDNTNNWKWIKFGGGYFIAGGSGGTNKNMYSTDGLSWSAITTSGAGNYTGGADYSYDASTFVMVGSSGVNYHTFAETAPSTLVVDTLKTNAGIHTTSVKSLSESTIKAWIRFDASSGSPVIQNDYNIMAITDVGVGRFRLYFDTWMKSMSYHLEGITSNYPGSTTAPHTIQQSGQMAPSHVEIRCLQATSTEEDNQYNSVLICGRSDDIKRNVT